MFPRRLPFVPLSFSPTLPSPCLSQPGLARSFPSLSLLSFPPLPPHPSLSTSSFWLSVTQIGRVLPAPSLLASSTLSATSHSATRPGSIVKDLVADEEARKYAKRKFGDLQDSREANGRGRGWKKKKGKF
jgi:hypothetical protein